MKFIQNKDSLVIDGHDWMRMLRFPYFTVAKIREMKVGEELSMFEFAGPSGGLGQGSNAAGFSQGSNLDYGSVGARITRMHGGKWMLEVIWMAHIGKALRRGHIWSWVFFRLETGSIIRILPSSTDDDLIQSEQLVRKVCRLVARLSKMAEKTGDRQSMARMLAYPKKFQHVPYISFLDTIAAPLYGLKAANFNEN